MVCLVLWYRIKIELSVALGMVRSSAGKGDSTGVGDSTKEGVEGMTGTWKGKVMLLGEEESAVTVEGVRNGEEGV